MEHDEANKNSYSNDDGEDDYGWDGSPLQLDPLALICGGPDTPLAPTWLDLTDPQQVLYGLNGAGKSTVLSALTAALTGHGKGRLLTRLPVGPDAEGGLSGGLVENLAEMLLADPAQPAGVIHQHFIEMNENAAVAAFEVKERFFEWRTQEWAQELNWHRLIRATVASEHWLFEATGAGSWQAQPVLLVKSGSQWEEYLRALHEIDRNEDETLVNSLDLGLEFLWPDIAPAGAPRNVLNGLLLETVKKSTTREPKRPYWPFGPTITDVTDIDARTRERLTTIRSAHPSYWGYLKVGPEMEEHAAKVERDANNYLIDLLSDAPVLHLTLGTPNEWFMGNNCRWTATRYPSDTPLPLNQLSFAEERWAKIAIELALSDRLLPSPRWLLLDEPERGLHRAAEAHMARGIFQHVAPQTRTVLATHSPELLNASEATVHYVRRRSAEQTGGVLPLGRFDNIRHDLGLTPADMLRRTRAFILVEGEHDQAALEGCFGDDLVRLGAEVIPIRGASNLKTIVDSRFLYEFTDAVLFLMVDDLQPKTLTNLWRQAVTDARTQPPAQVKDRFISQVKRLEKKGAEYLREFLAASLENGSFDRVEPLGIPQSDVLSCLPVQALVPKATSWQQLRTEAARNRNVDAVSETQFKDHLVKHHRVELTYDNLRRIAAENPPHPDLKAILAAINERLTAT